MAWALGVIVTLAIGVPIGAWGLTRLRPPPAVTPLGTGYDPIDKWLLKQHSLPPLERERVRAAVLEGRRVRDPVLAAAARDLAAKVVNGEFKALRMTPAMRRIHLISAAIFAAVGIGLLVTSLPRTQMRRLGWAALDVVLGGLVAPAPSRAVSYHVPVKVFDLGGGAGAGTRFHWLKASTK